LKRLCLAVAAAAIGIQGCAFVPKVNHQVEAARLAHSQAAAEPGVASLAAAEWTRACEALDVAVVAWGTLQDPAVVDHLAYVARQRVEIARETARRAAAEAAIASARRNRDSMRAGNDR
jgi:hypothetical protein